LACGTDRMNAKSRRPSNCSSGLGDGSHHTATSARRIVKTVAALRLRLTVPCMFENASVVAHPT
jgi:hypothetical protein